MAGNDGGVEEQEQGEEKQGVDGGTELFHGFLRLFMRERSPWRKVLPGAAASSGMDIPRGEC
jgi:hypothetical protein